jgi:hypothetical protein
MNLFDSLKRSTTGVADIGDIEARADSPGDRADRPAGFSEKLLVSFGCQILKLLVSFGRQILKLLVSFGCQFLMDELLGASLLLIA